MTIRSIDYEFELKAFSVLIKLLTVPGCSILRGESALLFGTLFFPTGQ